MSNAINVKYTTPITVQAELKGDRLRADFSFNIHQDNANRQAIMIIEFKRIGMIRYHEFITATRPESDVEDVLEEMKVDNEPTTLEESTNALVITKQAIAYASHWECPFVALCDYDHLVLLRFDLEKEIAFVTTVPRPQVRKALLGFLEEACAYAKVAKVA